MWPSVTPSCIEVWGARPYLGVVDSGSKGLARDGGRQQRVQGPWQLWWGSGNVPSRGSVLCWELAYVTPNEGQVGLWREEDPGGWEQAQE